MPKKKGSKRKIQYSKIKPRKTRVSLNPLREQLSTLVDQANARVRALADYNAEQRQLDKDEVGSKALVEAERSKKRLTSRDKEEELFRANLKTRRDINREFARVQTFLNDFTSTIEGAIQFNKDLSLQTDLKGQFGGQWEATTGQRFNTEVIDTDRAKKAFELYRRIEEQVGGWERMVGAMQGYESLLGYGSENMIIMIYDMVSQNIDDEDVISIGAKMVNDAITNYETMKINMRSDYDYGVVDRDYVYRPMKMINRRRRYK